MMQKEPEALLNLFSARYQQKNLAHDKILTKAELTKIYKNNLMIAKLIISKIDLLDSHISENGQHAQIKLHLFSRYLLEFEGRQNILTQEEDWLSDVGLENGKLVYLHTEQTAAAKH
ncbi:hypothetical protein [Agitococcus lubricus]|nr:hypothetical protein [Agitococcus lubricus]